MFHEHDKLIAMKTEIRKGYAALGIVSLFWGTSYTASKIGNNYMPAIFMAAVRQFFTGLILTIYFVGKKHSLPHRADLKKIFIQGLLLLFLGNGLVTWSLEFISSGLAAIIATLTPLFIAIFSTIFNKYVKISAWMFSGLIIGFAGICIIFYDYIDQISSHSFITGISLSLLSVLAWSFGSVYSSTHKLSVNILFSVGLQMFISGSLLMLICFISGKHVSLMQVPAMGWYALLYLIFIGSLLSYSAYVFALSRLPAALVSVYAYINPVVAILLGWILLKEKMNALMLPGTVVILYGVYLVNREFNRQNGGKPDTDS